MTKPRENLPREPLTDDERTLIQALRQCQFQAASYDKSFTREMTRLAALDDGTITEGQRKFLLKCIIKYRRQHRKSSTLELAYKLGAERKI